MNLAKRVKQGGVTGVTGGSGCFRLQETELCSKYGVGGYPSIKYFMAGDKTPKDFHGGRQLRELKQFTEVRLALVSEGGCAELRRVGLQDTLEVKCNVDAPEDGCSAKEVKFIEAMRAKTLEARGKELDRLASMKVASFRAYFNFIFGVRP